MKLKVLVIAIVVLLMVSCDEWKDYDIFLSPVPTLQPMPTPYPIPTEVNPRATVGWSFLSGD